MMGILFMWMYRELTVIKAKRLAVAFLAVVIGANAAYIWIRKDPQYRSRAAPTRELIRVLNDPNTSRQPPIYVCDFPLHWWIGSEAVARFTRLTPADVVFSNPCTGSESHAVLRWDNHNERYAADF
jgi:hypothetical protein